MKQAKKGRFPRFTTAEDGIQPFPDVRIQGNRLYVPSGWVPISRRGGDPWAYGEAKQTVPGETAKWEVVCIGAWEVPDMELEDNGKAVPFDGEHGMWRLPFEFLCDLETLKPPPKDEPSAAGADADGTPRQTLQKASG